MLTELFRFDWSKVWVEVGLCRGEHCPVLSTVRRDVVLVHRHPVPGEVLLEEDGGVLVDLVGHLLLVWDAGNAETVELDKLLVVLGQLVPPLDLPAGQAGVPPSGHAVVAAALARLGGGGGAPDVLEQSVLKVPLLPQPGTSHPVTAVLSLLTRSPHLGLDHGLSRGWWQGQSASCSNVTGAPV